MLDAILIVEDDDETRHLLARAFRRKGLQVLTAEDGAAGLELIRRHHPGIVVLDLIMPKLSGEELCATLRADPELADVHVIMLTGLIKPDDKVAGFEVGADDYVTKPFDLREVILRVEAALRRQRDRRAEREEGFIISGALRLDISAPRAWVRGTEVPLTAAEYRILLALAERPGKVFSREDLAEEIGAGDEHASPRSVDTHIMRLRQKLGSSAIVVETVRGSGYRFAEFV